MNDLESLYEYADGRGIDVDYMILHRAESLSVEYLPGRTAICIDPTRIEGSRDEKMKLSHELGHCEMLAFYHSYSPHEMKARQERKAETWQIKKLVPKDELEEAFYKGVTEPWDLAEYFDVPEPFLRKAVEYYMGQTL